MSQWWGPDGDLDELGAAEIIDIAARFTEFVDKEYPEASLTDGGSVAMAAIAAICVMAWDNEEKARAGLAIAKETIEALFDELLDNRPDVLGFAKRLARGIGTA